MRVLFWSSTFWPQIGGTELFAAGLLPRLRQRGHECIVVTSQTRPDWPAEATYEGFPIHRFPFSKSPDDVSEVASLKRRVAGLKRRFMPDLIHANSAGRDQFFHLSTAAAYPAPLLYTLHGEWLLHEPMGERVLRGADWVVGSSKATLERARQVAPEIVSRSCVIYNAVEDSTVPDAGLSFQTPRILCLGRLSQEKGFDLALTAFASIVARFPDARLVIAGDGREWSALQQQVVALDLGKLVEFMGWVAPAEVPALINTATIVLMPSRVESFPLVALEAGIMGRPVIATRIGGLPELVLHGETGMLVEQEDVRALGEAIAFLLEHPRAAAQMGRSARARVQKEFIRATQADAYDALYRKLVVDWERRNATSPRRLPECKPA